jgi:seryl-tRNA synthetase/acyl carrier protein
MSAALEREILAFVNGRLLRDSEPVAATARLFEDGYLDSLKVLELVAFVEEVTGRRVAIRDVRLATFRSVRAIALAFGGDATHAGIDANAAEAEEPLYRYHMDAARFASPLDALRRSGELKETAEGAIRLAGRAARLFDFFVATFERWGRELGAREVSAKAVIGLETLDRAGFTSAFPQLLVRTSDGHAYSPAACYHCYHRFAGQTLEADSVLAVRANCRRAEVELRALERSESFTMHELVVLGAPQSVERLRRRVLRRVDRFVTMLALDGAIEPASDPFFTNASAARALAQRAGALKLELRLTLEAERRLAVVSFNRHHDHFGRAFSISIGGAPAHSGCIAFGIERWVLAFLTQHGLDERSWPVPVRHAMEHERVDVTVP